MVAWSTPEGIPPPWLGVQESPSLSLNAARLSTPVNWETKVRLVNRSVKRIASRLCCDVVKKLLSSQVAVAGEVQSLKVTRNVCRSVVMGSVAVPLAWNFIFLVFQSAPQEGSRACCRSGEGAGWMA